jgi:hypothetical protein
MKTYSVGVRNNKKHPYSLVFQTNNKGIAKLVSLYYKPFVNEIDISTTEELLIRKKLAPFANTYVHKNDVENMYYYIWRGWWQSVGEVVYDTWNGEKYSTYFPLEKEELYNFNSIYKYS